MSLNVNASRIYDDSVTESLHELDAVDLHDTVIAHRDATWCTWPAAECPNDPFGSLCDVAPEIAELTSRGEPI